MPDIDGAGWSTLGIDGWKDVGRVREVLVRGADPDLWGDVSPLHEAALWGSPQVVAELACRVGDVDGMREGRTALWNAVFGDRLDNARALVAAGADLWRPVMAGWSPGRLSLAGRRSGVFTPPPGERGLDAGELAAVAEAQRLTAALGDFFHEGMGLACAAGIDSAGAARRLDAAPHRDGELDTFEDALGFYDGDQDMEVMGLTDVPGGCVVTQPWGYAPTTTLVMELLSAGTVCYGMYANAKSGNQGDIARDGVIVGHDLHPGGGDPDPADSPGGVLAAYLYQDQPIAFCCACAGLRPTDARAFTGPPDIWVNLPERDCWH
ncbi:ankyrin repeat domain-containing protein [Streptomyces uncialis]|uniref:ankyrin repeat domain-containing protein n=1 Tax=Streptomyces uncialis TaxID=1048205 RepID=UPI0037F2D8C2